jgi:macrolide transport system ATP-binding/permease protein
MPEWDGEIRKRLAGLSLTGPREAELIDEVSAHLDDLYRDGLARGLAAEESRRVALESLDEDDWQRGMRPLRQSRMPEPIALGTEASGPRRLLAGLWRDLRYGARTLRSNPGFTAAAVLTLALGIGANTAIFSLVSAVLLRSLPVREPERLVQVTWDRGGVLSYPEYAELRDGSRTFEGRLAAWGGIVASLNAAGQTELVVGVIATGNFFEVLGVRAALGRLLSPSDDVTPGAHPVAVISHRLWQGRFNGEAGVVGRDVLLNGHRFTIVGVTPEGFNGAQLGALRDLYVPMMMQAVMRPPRAGYSGEMDPDLLRRRTNRWLFGLGRLEAGTTPEQAAAALSVLSATVGPPPPAGARPRTAVAVPVNTGDGQVRARLSAVAALLMSVVGAVLLLACANVANLMLSRAAARRREIAVRLALGASRRQLVAQLLTESVLVSLLGGAAGLALAFAVVSAFRALPPPPGALPLALELTIDLRVLAFTLVLATLSGVAFGLAPAVASSRLDLVPVLKDESFVPDTRARRFNLRRALVVAQVALSLVLLVTAGLFLRNLREVQRVRPGFDVERLVSAQLPVNLLRYTSEQGRAFYRTVTERVEAIPGVQAATVARVPVLGGSGRITSTHLEGRPSDAERVRSEGGGPAPISRDVASGNVVGPRYFQTLGIPMRLGRDFETRDTPEAPKVAIANEAFVRVQFPDAERGTALGRRISIDGPEGPWREIVGVVGDSKYGSLTEEPTPIVYVPLSQNHETGMVLYVRTSAPPGTVLPAVRAAVQSVEPNLPLPDLHTVAETVATSLYVPRMGAILLGVFAVVAVLLAAIGVYGVTSFAVAQRTREIGVRMALGAAKDDILALVVKQGMGLVAVGMAAGLLLAFAAGRSLASFLYGIRGTDPATFLAVPLVLAAVALVACLVPARRAMRLDPLAALRHR